MLTRYTTNISCKPNKFVFYKTPCHHVIKSIYKRTFVIFWSLPKKKNNLLVSTDHDLHSVDHMSHNNSPLTEKCILVESPL